MDRPTDSGKLTVWLFLAAVAVLLLAAKSVHYLLFHTLAELIAIMVSFSIFTLTWTSKDYLKNSYLMVLGAAYGTIWVVDLFHTLTFKGMNLFPWVTTNFPTQFWLTARFIEALALVAAPLLIRHTVTFGRATLAFALAGLAGSLAVWLGILPATYVDGIGLTAFKIVAEYVIVAMLVAALALLWHERREFPGNVYPLVAGSVFLAIATEVCFIHYVGFYDFINELGHYFRLLSVVLAYLAIVVTGVRQPAGLLFRQVVEKEQALAASNARLAESEEHFKLAQSVAGVGSWHFDIASNTLTWSDEAYRLFGIPHGTPLSMETVIQRVHPDDRAKVRAAWDSMLAGAPFDIEHRIVADEQVKWVHERAEAHLDPGGVTSALLGTMQDITERQELMHQLQLQANTDYLTGLFNRRHFIQLANHELAKLQRYDGALSIAMLDLDNFKIINDTYGHEAGDMILVATARVGRQMLRESDVMARMGGEEFAILLPYTTGSQAKAVVERLRQAIAALEVPLPQGLPISFTTSIGVTCFDKADTNVDVLLHRADQALYAAKRGGRNRTETL